MILFDNWIIQNTDTIIARQYDNLSRSLVVTGNLPEGWDWYLLVSCRDNFDAILLTPMDGGVGVKLTDSQLAYSGQYAMQLRGVQGDIVRHSNVIQVYIPLSLSGTGTWPTVPSEFTAMEVRMRDIAAHPPIPGENGYWQLYDPDTGEYAESKFPLPEGVGGGTGADGGYYAPTVTQSDVNTMLVSYTPSKTGMPAVQAVKVTLPAGPQGIQGVPGPAGPQGPAGATPQRGIDYWTAEDIAAIQSYVDDAILGGAW